MILIPDDQVSHEPWYRLEGALTTVVYTRGGWIVAAYDTPDVAGSVWWNVARSANYWHSDSYARYVRDK